MMARRELNHHAHPSGPHPPRSALQERGSASEYSPWAVALPYLHRIYSMVPCTSTWGTYLGQKLFASFIAQASEFVGSSPLLSV